MRRIYGILAVIAASAVVIGVTVALVVPRVGATPPPGAAPFGAGSAHQPCGVAWSVSPGPNVGNYRNELLGVATIGPRDAWAVGTWQDGGQPVQPLVEHWDGQAWSVATVPTPSAGNGKLTAVAALSPSNVWAVGYYYPAFVTEATLVEHWDGARWSIVASANLAGERSSLLSGVTAISSADVWAVGYAEDPSVVPLTEHWNGTQWSVVPATSGGSTEDSFNAVAAVATNNVWAVGDAYDAGAGTDIPLAEQWNGRTWRIASNGLAGANLAFAGVAADARGAVWAVGASDVSSGAALMARWDGSQWRTMPASAAANGGFDAVSIVGNTQRAWAVGSMVVPGRQIAVHTLANLWNGSAWVASASPSPNPDNYLRAVSATSPNDVWAVGDDLGVTLIEHYHGGARGTSCGA